jgi:hypothetical protein
LYSAFLACIAIVFRSNLIPKFTVATIFLITTDRGTRMGQLSNEENMRVQWLKERQGGNRSRCSWFGPFRSLLQLEQKALTTGNPKVIENKLDSINTHCKVGTIP